ncbi:MAG: hypothetical protein A2Z27_05835 [candidate division Zixibacteria bacterium RBG_16_50_21]|nr:MAG: hypothetical protein A2Z27_05835 [candidate division Zixibacteria bacterium RBG_16_50_21]
MPDTLTASERAERVPTALDTEAKRLLEFKKQNIRRGNLTPCPQCATLININANKCPHCTSEIGKYNQKIRSELGKLNQLSGQLYDLHKRQMELYQHEAEQKPFWQRIKELFADPQVLQDLKVVLPTLVSFFALILFLRGKATGLIFWLVSVGGGFLVYLLLKKWNVRKYLTVDMYRTVLVIGVTIILVASLDSSMKFWPDISLGKGGLEVAVSAAVIREGPSTGSDVVTTVNQGADLKILEQKGSWYRVRTESGQTGWVHASLVK